MKGKQTYITEHSLMSSLQSLECLDPTIIPLLNNCTGRLEHRAKHWRRILLKTPHKVVLSSFTCSPSGVNYFWHESEPIFIVTFTTLYYSEL